ncbi:hypothetical protein ES703_107771 [subsurface metagenome]
MTKYSAVCEYVEDGDTFKTAKGTWIRLANVCAPDKSDGGYEKAKGGNSHDRRGRSELGRGTRI